MSTSNFLDFKGYCNSAHFNMSINTKREKVVWNDIKVLKVDKSQPNSLFYKSDYDQEEFNEIDLRRNGGVLQKAYKESHQSF